MANRTSQIAALLVVAACAAWSPSCAGEESLESRRQRLDKMPPDELLELSRKKERFEQLPVAKKDELRRLYADLSADDNTEKLQEILDRYHRWLQTLTAAQRAELLSLSPDQRVAKIRKIQQDQKSEDEKRFGRPGRQISPEDQQAILNWLDQLAIRHEEEFLKNTPQRAREFVEQIPDARRRRLFLVGSALRPRGDGGRAFVPSPEEFQSLHERLSPPLRKELGARASKEGTEQLQDIIRIAMFNMWQPTPAELERFYREDLTATDQEWLDGMPRERFQRELRKLYFEQLGRRGGGPEGMRGQFPGRGPGGFGEGGPRGFKGDNRPGMQKGTGKPVGPAPPASDQR